MTLGKKEIESRLSPSRTIDESQIVVTPLLQRESQLGNVEINLRLGRQFLLFKKHMHPVLAKQDLSKDEYERKIGEYQEEVVIPYNIPIVLHPGSFIVGSTLEYIALPRDIEAQVEGRSSWARLGLIIATATTIHPLFKGVITLELSNNGSIPLELRPGREIAQLIFHSVESPAPLKEKKSRYFCQIGPVFSRIYNDKEMVVE